MAQDIPQYIRDAYDRTQAEIGGMGGFSLELEPFSQGFQDAEAGIPTRGNHPSYYIGHARGSEYRPQPANAQPRREEPRREEPRRDERQPPNAGRGRPIRFGFFQQRPGRQE